MGRSQQTINIKIGDHTLNQVQSFKYLGSIVNEQSTQEEQVKKKIAKYNQNVGCMLHDATGGQECTEES